MIGFCGRFGWLLVSCAVGYFAQAHFGGGVPCELAVLSVVYLAGVVTWYGVVAR